MSSLLTVNSLHEFTAYQEITIVCHNYPDADAIGSGFALYQYFNDHSAAKVRLVYGGASPIMKTNLVLLVQRLAIPIEHCPTSFYTHGLVITVDCQLYGNNVTDFPADKKLVIDHHRILPALIERYKNEQVDYYIKPEYGSCASAVYRLFQKENYMPNIKVSTALFYGLYMDTNEFSELREPADREARDELYYDDGVFTLIKNSNLNPQELMIAGTSMQRYQSFENLAFIEADECDPNILGLIADMLIRVENITTAIVFNRLQNYGFSSTPVYKFSVRSCVGEVRANDLTELIASPVFNGKPIGGGGGHRHKAGGKVFQDAFEQWSANKPFAGDFTKYICAVFAEYSKSSKIIYADTFDFTQHKQEFAKYTCKPIVLGYMRSTELAEPGCRFLIRHRLGDIHEIVSEDLYITVGIKGDINVMSRRDFEAKFIIGTEQDALSIACSDELPVVIEKSGSKVYLHSMLHPCKFKYPTYVYAHHIPEEGPTVKLLDSKWTYTDFKFGNLGDYVVIDADNYQAIDIVSADEFKELFTLESAEVGCNS